jgi:hypothetical protein
VVDAPDVVGVLRNGQFAKPWRGAPPHPPRADQTRALEDLARRRRRRPIRLRLAFRKLVDDLARSPGRTLSPQADDRLRQVLRRRTAVRGRSARPLRQSGRPFDPVPFEPLAAGFPANLVALAKLRHRPFARSMLNYEAQPLVHRTALSPRHRLVLPAKENCHPSFRSVSTPIYPGCTRRALLPFTGEGGPSAQLLNTAHEPPTA